MVGCKDGAIPIATDSGLEQYSGEVAGFGSNPGPSLIAQHGKSTREGQSISDHDHIGTDSFVLKGFKQVEEPNGVVAKEVLGGLPGGPNTG